MPKGDWQKIALIFRINVCFEDIKVFIIILRDIPNAASINGFDECDEFGHALQKQAEMCSLRVVSHLRQSSEQFAASKAG